MQPQAQDQTPLSQIPEDVQAELETLRAENGRLQRRVEHLQARLRQVGFLGSKPK